LGGVVERTRRGWRDGTLVGFFVIPGFDWAVRPRAFLLLVVVAVVAEQVLLSSNKQAAVRLGHVVAFVAALATSARIIGLPAGLCRF
jgi:hypothetical protein